MRYRAFGVAVLAAGVMTGTAFVQAAEQSHADWGYAGNKGPTHWAELEHDFTSCKAGHAQSPIDIHGAKTKKLSPLAFHYLPAAGEVVNNGHTVQVNLEDAGSVGLASGDYKLVQFHFHTPSEEAFNGKHYPLVAHLVHKNAAGELAVVAVLFKQGRENAALKQVFAELPAAPGEKHALAAQLDLMATLPKHHAYYAYTESLTTPPCSEGVHWQVMKEPAEVSKRQLAAFRKLYAMNARPIQPRHNREVDVGG